MPNYNSIGGHALREKDGCSPSNDALEALARRLYPAIRSYFESEDGQREFAEWKAQKENANHQDSGTNVKSKEKAT